MSKVKAVHLAFERDLLEIDVAMLQPSRILPTSIGASVKYRQVRDSIRAVGLVEPLVVLAHAAHQGAFTVLDGHIRLEALKELNVPRVLCLQSTDDETYTYNKRVSRLSVVQEHRMILRAIDRGVALPRLAEALGLSQNTIRDRFKLLDGICEDAVRLLADKPATQAVFRALRQMTPFRQIDVARSMISLNNYSVKLSLAMLQNTPESQLIESAKAKAVPSAPTETLVRMQRELAALDADTKLLEESYGPANLQLVIIKTYIKSLLENLRVVHWLARAHRDYLQQLQLIAEVKSLPSS